MKKLTKITVLFVCAALLIAVFAACGAEESGTVTNVKLSVKAGDTVILNEVDVAVKGDAPTVMDAFRQAMDDDDAFPNVVFQEDENGDPVRVLDVGEFVDTAEKFWEFKVNDLSFNDIKKQASVYEVKEGDRIYFEYGASEEPAE